MKSILSVAAVVLLGASNVVARAEYPAAALVYRQWDPIVAEGCYSSSSGLTYNSTWTFNSKGYCQKQCATMGNSIEATTAGDQCWCGNNMPPESSKVDDSFCSTICTGYGVEMCGGTGYFSVYLSGTTEVVPPSEPSSTSSSSTSSSAISHPKTSATTSASPSVVTIGGQTVVVTAPASHQTSAAAGKSSSGSGTNKAAIAAGVVVGVVVIAAAAGGAFLYLRHRKRRAVEEEYRRNAAVSSFANGGKAPPSAGGSSFTDTRLDPSVMAQRRMSDGSIADNQDYSRRILKVTNA